MWNPPPDVSDRKEGVSRFSLFELSVQEDAREGGYPANHSHGKVFTHRRVKAEDLRLHLCRRVETKREGVNHGVKDSNQETRMDSV